MFLIFIDMFVGDDLDMKNAAANAGSNEQLHPASIPENYLFHGAHCVGHDLQNALDIGGVGSVCVVLDPRMAGSFLAKNIRALWAGKF
ncbi:hypothetical protein C0J52_00785 [Blattella germanica]|nr:hypothetical protein C0J52_00785 [Blattella germanica]